MKPDASHIRQIKVVSNTHWDREFRRSFEKTRRRLLTMLDTVLDILEKDPQFHSFTLDGHSILLEDYLEMRPERRGLIEELLAKNRLIAGPWYTLPEEFSIGAEPLVRNLMLGRQTVQKFHGRVPTVAYTPSSWGQTGQLPQILADFGCSKMMFYRGISHHEADAEWIWAAPDGTRVLASRFALYARYNWYYLVHRPVTVGRVFEKDYVLGECADVPFRFADGLAGEDLAFDAKSPVVRYHPERLEESIRAMVALEGAHFTTPVFLAMNGSDISGAYPLESKILDDARKALAGKYEIQHTDLEGFWAAAEEYLDTDKLPVLTGERRAYLKQGMWTYLFPATISARTYLKQKDFAATGMLVAYAEPLSALAAACGGEYPQRYLDRGWRYLLSNHTHDANGGCAPDIVCQDMEYRYRKASDIGEIAVEDAMAHVAVNLSSEGQPADAMQLLVVNPLPFARDVVALVDVEMPAGLRARNVRLWHHSDPAVAVQPISCEKGGCFVDSIWDVVTILDSNRIKFYAELKNLPALGYRAYRIEAEPHEPRSPATLVTGPADMANEHLAVHVNGNGTVTVHCLATGKVYHQLNYLTDQGEVGNAWRHTAPPLDRKYNSLGVAAAIAVVESGPLAATISADYALAIPQDCADGKTRSARQVDLPVHVEYRLEKGAAELKITLSVDNRALDHWLRANFPTGLATDATWADSHFDVVSRPIPTADSTGWVERAGGTHPLRTFVAMSDGRDGLALMPKGIFEYEAFEDDAHTLALTLVRGCRIKLAVSEEKLTELPDPGVQCGGPQRFEYAVAVHLGTWSDAAIPRRSAAYAAPPRAAQVGHGRGSLPDEFSLLLLDNADVHVTAIKQAEDGRGLIVRLFNTTAMEQSFTLTFGRLIASASLSKLDEEAVAEAVVSGHTLTGKAGAKKIRTYRVVLA